MGERGDTRGRIQDVALEMFTEQGYEGTSLREIAERLGVTKAALYYHFKTKDDIVASLIADRQAKVEEMAAWLRGQPVTVDTRREFIRRYAAALSTERSQGVMRFLEANQLAIKAMTPAIEMRDRMLEMFDLLMGDERDPRQRLRISMAIFTLHASLVVLRTPDLDDKQRQEAALEVALSLVDPPPAAAPPGAAPAG